MKGLEKLGESVGKALQKPHEREEEKKQYLDQAEPLKQQADEIVTFFTATGADAQKLQAIQTLQANLGNAIETIKGWSSIHTIDQGSKNNVSQIINQSGPALAPYKKEMDTLKQQQQSKPAP